MVAPMLVRGLQVGRQMSYVRVAQSAKALSKHAAASGFQEQPFTIIGNEKLQFRRGRIQCLVLHRVEVV